MSEDDANTRRGDGWLDPSRALRVTLPADAEGRPREALIVQTSSGPRAFLNRCPHLDVPLDAGSADYGPRSGHLVCATHGARFRVEDGRCVWGPCDGDTLEALALVDEGGELRLRLEGSTYRVEDRPPED